MKADQSTTRSVWFRVSAVLFSCYLFVALSGKAAALCGLYEGAIVQIERVTDTTAAQKLRQQLDQTNRVSNSRGVCIVCHLYGGGGPRNTFGTAANILLSIKDREAFSRSRKVGLLLSNISADPRMPDSPTFGELFQQGQFPALASRVPEFLARSSPAPKPRPLTPQQARQIVIATEAKSPWEILELSRLEAITPEVAAELAAFRGEMLILGVRSLSPQTAAVLAESKVASIWLPSLTTVSLEAATFLSTVRGDLALTALTELESVSLAEKLAARNAALSFPYLRSVSVDIAAALVKNNKELTLGAFTQIPAEVQDKLAETTGILYMPGLNSIDSLALALKLIQGSRVFLPNLKKLTSEQATLLAGIKSSGLFFGGIFLPSRVTTPEVAGAIALNPNRVNVTLIGTQPLPAEVLETLLRNSGFLTLRDVTALTPQQILVVDRVLKNQQNASRLVMILSLPSLKSLESPTVALALGTTNNSFPSVTSISREVADTFGKLPEATRRNRDGTVEFLPSGELWFPSLEELSPETARLLMQRRWQGISLPAVEDYSVEMIKSFTKNCRNVTLGLTSLPVELAAEFDDSLDIGHQQFSFPKLTDLAPESARTLVKRLNKELTIINTNVRQSMTPYLRIGGDNFDVGVVIPSLKPEVAVELAKYNGNIYLAGLGELPDATAEALSRFQGAYLFLDGPGVRTLGEKAATALATMPGNLQISLLELSSVALAKRFARQISWTLSKLEVISNEATPALIQYKQIFSLRQIIELDSPELAQRLLKNFFGPTLPALSRLSPKAAEVIAKSSNSVLLGLEYLDSPEIAQSLCKVSKGVSLPRLRAATPAVIAVLKESKSIKVDQLDSLYVLSETKK